MSHTSLTVLASRVLLFSVLCIALSACSSSSSIYEEEMKKEEYLKSNFPAKKQGKNTSTPVETTFDR